MTMPASGPISLGQANTELGRSATATLSMNDSQLRALAGVGGSGTTWSMNSLYGKGGPFPTVSLATLPSNSVAFFTGDFTIECRLVLIPDGVWEVLANNDSLNSGAWGIPTNSGSGANYWVKFTRTSFAPVGAVDRSTPTTDWENISVDQSVSVFTYFDDIDGSSAIYTVQIATDSVGSNIIATKTGVRLVAVPGSPP